MRKIIAAILLSLSVNALACPPDATIVAEIQKMNASYKDVKSPISCQKPKNKLEKTVCTSPGLIVLSELDAKAQVYGLENATGQQASHTNVRDAEWEKNVLSKCKDETCICDAYTAHIQEFLPEFNQ